MPTVITKTIGKDGWQDYSTFAAAEAAVATIAGGSDLVSLDVAVVFEAEAGTYSENVTFQSSLTTDATRQVTYKAAAGSEHGGDKNSGVRLSGTGFTLNCQATEKFLRFEGIVIRSSVIFGYVTVLRPEGLKLSSCIVEATGAGTRPVLITDAATSGNPVVIENSVLISAVHQACYIFCSTADCYGKVVNCTLRVLGGSKLAILGIETGGFSIYPEVLNCLVLNEGTGGAWSYSGSNATGSNNFGGSTDPFPAAIQGSPYPITATTNTSPGAGDWAIYDATTGALVNVPDNSVIGEGTATGAPTTDINGEDRIRGASDEYVDPGAFSVDKTTYTKSIGAGRDYATFTAAEAAVNAIPYDTNLAERNLAVVFEADAGTYSESVSFSSSLTTDATRNVTYRPASGSEHGGSLSAGVIVSGSSGNTAGLYDDFINFEGIVLKSSASYAIAIGADGVTVDGLVLANTNSHVAILQNGTALNPVRCLNCVAHATNGYGFYIFGTSTAAHVHLVNSTAIVSSGTYAIRNYGSAANLTLINHLGLVTSGAAYQAVASPTITGSNCFSTGTGALPGTVQGTPYPITATTTPPLAQAIGRFTTLPLVPSSTCPITL